MPQPEVVVVVVRLYALDYLANRRSNRLNETSTIVNRIYSGWRGHKLFVVGHRRIISELDKDGVIGFCNHRHLSRMQRIPQYF